MNRVILPLVCALACVVTSYAQAPRLIPFQGRLTDPQGHPTPDGARLIQFQIYGEQTGGSALWAGEIHRTTVNGGLVNVLLGSKNPLPLERADDPSKSFFDRSLYLQITVDSDTNGIINAADAPLLPRQAILPVVFAADSANAHKLAGHDWTPIFGANDPTRPIPGEKIAENSIPGKQIQGKSMTDSQLAPGIAVPIGGIIMWWGSTAAIPTNFELCDGGTPSTPGAALSGPKPDLRDRFVKGATSSASDVVSSPITGGQHFLNLNHTHEMNHYHGSDGLWVPFSGGPRDAIWFGELGGQNYARGFVGPGYRLVIGPTRGTSGEEQQSIKPGTAVLGDTSYASRTHTAVEEPGLGTTDNRPAFLEMFFIIRVK